MPAGVAVQEGVDERKGFAGFVQTRWHAVFVPGSYGLPYGAESMLAAQGVDVAFCVGILLNGGIIHMKVFVDDVACQLMQLQVMHVPMFFYVLPVLFIEIHSWCSARSVWGTPLYLV